MKKFNIAVSLLAMLALQAGAPETGFSQDKIPDAVAEIFDNRCAFSGCHVANSPDTDLDLTEKAAFGALVNQKSVDLEDMFLVQPGDYKKSYLFWKLMGIDGIKGDRMPPKGDQPLSKKQLQTIAKWIKSLPKSTNIQPRQRQTKPSFPGLSTGSLQTAQTVNTGSFSYRIAHRWMGRIDAGFGQFFGLDAGAHVLTEFSFPLSDRLSFTAGRSGSNATFVFNGKWKILQQATTPISMALVAGVDWITLRQISDPNNPAQLLSRASSQRFAWYGQLAIERQLSRKLAVLFNPGLLLNGNVTLANEDAVVCLAFAGKFNLSRRVSVFFEMAPVVAGSNTVLPVGGTAIKNGQPRIYDAFTFGLEHSIGGHVFHLYATNSLGLTPSQVMSGGNLDFLNGGLRLGFNIYRAMRLGW